jgi:cysteine-rich repeat protein
MKNILSFTATLITSAVAVAACVDTSTSTCADGARCPAGNLCVEQPDGPVCVPAARVHECMDKNEAQQCHYDETDSPARCRAGICTLMECGNGYVDRLGDWEETCDDGNRVDADGCSRDCQLRCGDGIVQYEKGELCDVQAPLSESCLDRGFDMGTLACASSCQDVSIMSCIDFDWQPVQGVPDDWHFARVWVFSPEYAVALGKRGAPPLSFKDEPLCIDCGDIFEYDGTSWHLREEVASTLSNLWANGPEDIYAVGALGNIWHYDGVDWTSMPEDPNYQLAAMWGTDPDNLFAVGVHWQPSWPDLDLDTARPVILRYDGDDWTPMVLPEEYPLGIRHGLVGIWGSGTNNVFAVGSYGTILHYDGNPEGIWMHMDVPPSIGPDQIFLDVWGTDATDVTVVGDQGTILRYDGHEWSLMNSPTNQALTGIWGTPEGKMFTVGVQGMLLGYDPLAGAEWSMMESGISSDLADIHGSSADNILAVGPNGAILRRDSSAWAAMDLQSNQKAVNQIWGSGLDCMYAVDQGGQIWHYDGNPSWRWTLTRPMDNEYPWSPWSDVHGLGCNGQIFVVGSSRPALRYQDGAWMEMQGTENVDTLDLQAVWAAEPDAVFAVGRKGTILRYDGNQELRWAPMDSGGVAVLLTDVWGTSPDNVFAVGNEGTILHYDGNSKGTWTRMSSGVDRVLNGLWGTGPDNVFAVGETTILHYDGKDWTPMAFPIFAGTLQAIWGSHARHVFAASETGRLYHYDGTQWSPMHSPTDVTIPSIWGTPDGEHIFVTDTLGRIFRLALPPEALPAD